MTSMAKHDVSFEIPSRELGKADVEFKVKRNKETLGKLQVSNGSIVWIPKHETYGHRLGWSDFDELMTQHGKKKKKSA
jgi:hypothetical protein